MFFLIPPLFWGCSRCPRYENYVPGLIGDRINKQVIWGPLEERAALFSCLLEQEINADIAVQIALLNNPEIQSLFEDIGIAKADLWQAVLFKNPVFDGAIRPPTQSGFVVNLQFSVMQNIIDILAVPLRKQVAIAELERTQMHVADEILNMAFDVKETYYRLVFAIKNLDYLSSIVEATEAIRLLAQAQRIAGNINDIELQDRTDAYVQAKIDYAIGERDLIDRREKFYRLLGLSSSCTCLNLVDEFPDVDFCEFSEMCLDEVALSSRLDLAVERFEIRRTLSQNYATPWWIYTEGLFGFSYEREPEGVNLIGPAFSVALPIIDFGQATRAQLFHKYLKHVQHLKAAEITTLAEVHEARDLVFLNREVTAKFLGDLIPLRESMVSTGLKFYNVMGYSIYTLLDKKVQEFQAELNYTAALRDYWLSKVSLDRAVGGDLGLLCVQ